MSRGPAAAPPGVADPVVGAVAYVLRSTAERPQTEAEVRARLVARGLDEGQVDAALERLHVLRAVDDRAFATAWVADRGQRRGFGATRLREELRRRLVPEPLIADALSVLEDRDDEAVATDLAAERAPRLPPGLAPEAAARRLHSFLVRRGYAPGLAQRVAIDVSGLGRRGD